MEFFHTLSAAQAGDQTAAAELLERWRPLLRLQAARLLGADLCSRIGPSDVVQETLAQAADLVNFRGREPREWVAWLGRLLAGHVAKSVRYHRAQKRDIRRQSPLQPSELASAEPPPDVQVTHIEEARRLAEAIERPPESMQTAILHRAFFDQPWEEVARLPGTTPGCPSRSANTRCSGCWAAAGRQLACWPSIPICSVMWS